VEIQPDQLRRRASPSTVQPCSCAAM